MIRGQSGDAILQTSVSDLSPQVVLLEKDGRYYFYQPATGLITSGDDVASAYRKFDDAKCRYMDDVRRAGLEIAAAPAVTQATGVAIHRGFLSEIALFATKCGLVLVLIGGIGVVAVNAIQSSLTGVTQGLSRAAAAIGSITLSDVVTKSDDIVRDLGTLPENRKEDLRRNAGEISRQLTPIIETWRNPPASAGAR